jgi:type IV secretion system protein VirD4
LEERIGLSALDNASRHLYETALPRDVSLPRLEADRQRINAWMSPHELAQHSFVPGQIIIGKFAGRLIGHLDDRPMVTVAGARSGKTSTVLEQNLYCYPGSMLVMDPKRELLHTAAFRRALGHNVIELDPFGDGTSSHFNPLAELNPDSRTIIDDVRALADALIVDDGDARSRHWNDGAKTLLVGIILLTLTRPPEEHNLITVREILTLTYPQLLEGINLHVRKARTKADGKPVDENRIGVETLLRAMSQKGTAFGGILAAIGNRFRRDRLRQKAASVAAEAPEDSMSYFTLSELMYLTCDELCDIAANIEHKLSRLEAVSERRELFHQKEDRRAAIARVGSHTSPYGRHHWPEKFYSGRRTSEIEMRHG